MFYAVFLCGFVVSLFGALVFGCSLPCLALRWSLAVTLSSCVISGMPPFFGNGRITGEDELSLGTFSFPHIADRDATNANERAEDREGTGPKERRMVSCGGMGEQLDDVLPVGQVLMTLSRVAR